MFSYRKELMGQVLAIVAESGVHGMEYNGLLSIASRSGNVRQSSRFRLSAISAHKFSAREFEDYLILAWRFGLVERSNYREVEWKAGPNKSAYDLKVEVVRLTREGWEFIELNDRPLMHRWLDNILTNAPTIIVSVASALVSGWAIYYWGAPSP